MKSLAFFAHGMPHDVTNMMNSTMPCPGCRRKVAGFMRHRCQDGQIIEEIWLLDAWARTSKNDYDGLGMS